MKPNRTRNLQLIAACMESDGLMGVDNALPWPHLAPDMRHFQTFTRGKSVIMGRNTFESIGKPLPHRENIVLSKSAFAQEGLTVCASIADAIEQCASQPVIIGGNRVFQEALRMQGVEVSLTLLSHASWKPQGQHCVYFPLDLIDQSELTEISEFEVGEWRGRIMHGFLN